MRVFSKLRTFAVAALVLFSLAGWAAAGSWSFVSMADSRGSDNGVNTSVLSSIVGQVVAEAPDLVLFEGDEVNGSSSDATLASQLTHWRNVMSPLYTSGMYGAKVFAGPGNHELWYASHEVVWQSIFSDLPSNGPAGETYMTYSLDYENAHFVMLNTNRVGQGHTVNMAWLESDLAATDAQHIFVFGHEPAFPVGPHVGSSLDAYPEQRDAFWQLLSDYGVEIYFTGHEHLYDRIQVDGVYQVLNGTCGAPIYGGYGGDFYHHALIDVDGPNVAVSVIDSAGAVRDYFEYQTPVPEPTTLLLACVGIGGLLLHRKRTRA